MKRAFSLLWNWIEKSSIRETDTPELRRRKTTLVVVAILTCVAGALSLVIAYIQRGPLPNLALPSLYVIVVGSSLLAFRVTKRFGLLLHPFLFMMLLTPAVYQWSTGGLAGAGAVTLVLWSLLAPLGALMLQGLRHAVVLFLIYLLLVATGLVFDDAFTPLSIHLSHTSTMVAQAINIGGLSVTISLTVMYFVHAFQREHTKVESLVSDLSEANGTLRSTLEELEEMQTELVHSEKMASLGKLSAGIAHEINNPIGALKSTADVSARCVSKIQRLLKGDEELGNSTMGAQLNGLLEILAANNAVFTSVSDRVTHTVSSFIHFTRLDKAEFGRANIHEGLDSALVLAQPELGQNTDIVKDYGDIPEIACYPGDLNQVFLCLLANAAEASDAGGRITIRTRLNAESVDVEVSDTGPGLSPEQVQNLFETQFRSDGTRVRAGMGMLASQRIVENHHGRIQVDSEVGMGTTVTVTIPTDLDQRIRSV